MKILFIRKTPRLLIFDPFGIAKEYFLKKVYATLHFTPDGSNRPLQDRHGISYHICNACALPKEYSIEVNFKQ